MAKEKQKKATKDELATKIRAQQKKKGKKQTPKATLVNNNKRSSLVSMLNALGGSAIPGRATPKSAKKGGKKGGKKGAKKSRRKTYPSKAAAKKAQRKGQSIYPVTGGYRLSKKK